jgi:hypothetical protein
VIHAIGWWEEIKTRLVQVTIKKKDALLKLTIPQWRRIRPSMWAL